MIRLRLELSMKIIFSTFILFTFFSCSTQLEDDSKNRQITVNNSHILCYRFNWSEHSDYSLLLKFQSLSEVNFSKEIALLKTRIPQSLQTINNAMLAFKEKDYKKNKQLLFSITKDNTYFEYMVHCFSQCLNDQKGLDLLAVLIYESSMRHIQVLEQDCSFGPQRHYARMVSNDPIKKAVFDQLHQKMVNDWYKLKKGNWYVENYLGGYLDDKKLANINNPIERVLLGYDKKCTNYEEHWRQIHDLREDILTLLKDFQWSGKLEHTLPTDLLEELRSHVLIGHYDLVTACLKEIKLIIDLLEKQNVDRRGKRDQQSIQRMIQQHWAHYYYVKGLNLHLKGLSILKQHEKSKELFIGRQGVLLQYYLCIRKGNDTKWAKKAVENYE
jgi:hypothetical protein